MAEERGFRASGIGPIEARVSSCRSPDMRPLTDFGDGLRFYRRLLAEAPSYLKPGGYLLFEMGYQQAEAIKALVDRSVWSEPKALQDLQGIERTLVLTWV